MKPGQTLEIVALSMRLGALAEKRDNCLLDLKVANLQAILFLVIAIAAVAHGEHGNAVLTGAVGLLSLFAGSRYLKRAKRASRLAGRARARLTNRVTPE